MAFTAHSSERFATHIEHCVRSHNMSYLDAVMDYCDKHQLDPELIQPLLTTKIKTGIQKDAERLHLIKKRRELPFDD